MELYENFPPKNRTIYFMVNDTLKNPSYPMHWHNYIEIMYIIEGNNVVSCGNDVVEVKADHFCIIKSNELHQNISGYRSYAFLLVHPNLFADDTIVFKRVIKDEYLSEIIKKMISEYNFDRYSQLSIEGYGRLMMTHIFRNHIEKTLNEKEAKQRFLNRENLNKIIKYIHENYNKDITLDTLASIANLSKYHFCNIFKDFTGQTFKEYQNKLRITKAIELLFTTNLPITEIAFLCGYNDSNYFTRKFRQITGKTPNSARQESKENGTGEFKFYK